MQDVYEALVIGGGPAGLSAALYLARFERRTALFDAGQGRSTWHQVNHNYLGFPGGIAATRLRELGREQLGEYAHVDCIDHKVEEIRHEGDVFIASGQAGEWRGRSVVIATGVVDHYPHFDGWDQYVGRSMFWCVLCDGYTAKGKRVVVAGNTDDTASEAMQLSRFTDSLTVLTNSRENEISDTFQKRLADAGIPLIEGRIDEVVGHGGYFEALVTTEGQRIELDQLFAVQGSTAQSDLAAQLGVDMDEQGCITVNQQQETNVPGVFAAGDVTRRYDQQVSTAVHEGAEAAAAANYFLYPPALKDE
jgi:thioredoxin reductase (NADPH)